MEVEELANVAVEAMEYIQDEQARAGGVNIPTSGVMDMNNPVLSDQDLESLRKRLPFLVDFSDQFIRSKPMELILKIEIKQDKADGAITRPRRQVGI